MGEEKNKNKDIPEITEETQLSQFFKKQRLSLILFTEEWSESGDQAYDNLKELLSDGDSPKGVGLRTIFPEKYPELGHKFEITGIPTTILFVEGQQVFRLSGLRMRELMDKLAFYDQNKTFVPPPVQDSAESEENPEKLKERIKTLINKDNIMLFMKGTPEQPQCGFSRTIVGILNETGLPFSTFNILADNSIREGLKDYSNWRTYPQLYVKGELIGGLDIIKELKDSGDLVSTLQG